MKSNLYKGGLLLILLLMTVSSVGKQISSPNGKITLLHAERGNRLQSFTIAYGKQEVLTIPSIGILTKGGRGTGPLKLDKITGPHAIQETYTMMSGKRKNCSNEGVEYIYFFSDSLRREIRINFRLYNDGIAFRYELQGLEQDCIGDEQTTYRIPEGTKRWMQKYNLSYEDFYPETTSGEGENRHWGYPALIQTDDDVWTLITEAGIERQHSASSLKNESPASDYKVCLAQNEQVVTGNWASPWRVLIIGSLADVVESTLVTDVSRPCLLEETDWIHPGSVSWVYWAYNRGSKDFQIVKQYIDMAVQLKLPYVLIDWEWDVMGNGGNIEDALKYAAERGVRVLLWYNSSTAWTTNGAGGPLFKLNSPENREKEFAWLQQKGVAGIKIDFFSGDMQETMDYCLDLLECAARHKLLVNFHGATIPRGWQRTYPNLMTTEAVYGAEWYNNRPVLTNKAAAHNATLPFTRNVIGSMDYTPCTFSDSQHPHITTHAHELALSVVFESALQHWADRPESYLAQPEAVKQFMSELPSTWDDTHLVSGYPAGHVILARQKDGVWYVGGLNGTDKDNTLAIDWSFLDEGKYQLTIYKDSGDELKPWNISVHECEVSQLPARIDCYPRGGFVIVARRVQAKEVKIVANGLWLESDGGVQKVEFVSPDIVRIQYAKEHTLVGNGTDVCIPRSFKPVRFTHVKEADHYLLKSDSLMVSINILTGAVTYMNPDGSLLLRENQTVPRTGERLSMKQVVYDEHSGYVEQTADGDKERKSVLRYDSIGQTWRYKLNFEWQPSEALYGWGSHMEDYMNLRGKELYLCQHNLKVMVPVLNSTAGYGLLFDAGCAMIFRDNNEGSYVEMEAARQIDYYFMKGRTMDAVVANYRLLTGDSPMMPRYLFGYTQSKERYVSSDDLINTLKEYRQRNIPIDMIVQDWNYWLNGQWGTMSMNPTYYPDKKKLTDEIHALNAKLMISIWPNAMNSPQHDEFKRKGLLLKGASVYDAFNPLARDLYWKYANNEFFGNGFDAWWCDSSEPLDADWKVMGDNYGVNNHRQRWELTTALLSDALGAERSQTYSLYHAMGIYEHQRRASSAKRVVNLTRSGYAGQQRYATITWNGDTSASWSGFAQMIPAGLNFMSTGCPYWTIDVGAFFTKRGKQWFWRGDYDKGVADDGYRELYTRMFQYATFLPMLRSHGTDTPREVWRFGEPGQPFYDSLVQMIHLRYRLLPYIYSLAGRVHQEQYTMSRALAFDFASDAQVVDLKDEFMFGPALLVAPVTTPMYYGVDSQPLQHTNKTRQVYLPDGAAWVDFWTGEPYRGGQWINAAASLDKIPLLVRQGSIIPMGPVVQYSAEHTDAEWEIRIYPGADASFKVYEDEGDTYNYERGFYSTYELRWDDKHSTLTISGRKGKYAGIPVTRKLKIVKVSKALGVGTGETDKGILVEYKGNRVDVEL